MDQRRVSMSVRAFAEFGQPGGTMGGFQTLWRMRVGQAWHTTLQQNTEETYSLNGETAEFEKSVKGELVFGDWTFALQGRIDQHLSTANGGEIREVKTVSTSLPDDPDILLARYPSYPIQAACYLPLFKQTFPDKQQELECVLLLVNIEDGFTQRIIIENGDERLEEQANKFVEFLESRRAAEQRRLQITFELPFTELRPGQEEVQNAFQSLGDSDKPVCFEAPTGFGKTGLVLQHGLDAMRSNWVQRLVILSGKSTGQIQVCKQLSQMLKTSEDPPLVMQLRNQVDHYDGLAQIPSRQDSTERLLSLNALIPTLFDGGFLYLERIREFSEEHDLDPYEVSRAALPFADILVADYNYIFAPGVRGFLESSWGWNPQHTLLIIDEAHNLPGRVAAAWSIELNRADAESLRTRLFFEGSAYSQICQTLDLMIECIKGSEPDQKLSDTKHYTLADTLRSLKESVQKGAFIWEHLEEQEAQTLSNLLFAETVLRLATFPLLLIGGRDANIRIDCLDASREIELATSPFKRTIFMSATLSPCRFAEGSLGLAGHTPLWIVGQAPWRDGRYTIRHKPKIDTRFKQRQRFHQEISALLAELAESADSLPAVAFFSSYAYAETIRVYLEVIAPHLRVVIQEKGLNIDEQTRFIGKSLYTSDLLFLILGSSFSEGIDILGGHISHAAVIGPALPELSPQREALREYFSELHGNDTAFQQAYIIPGMQKINQALGRLVRSPEHCAHITLIGKRLSEPRYTQLLAPEYQTASDTP